jgi:hypothetical protein
VTGINQKGLERGVQKCKYIFCMATNIEKPFSKVRGTSKVFLFFSKVHQSTPEYSLNFVLVEEI